jgi:hypothetical protein
MNVAPAAAVLIRGSSIPEKCLHHLFCDPPTSKGLHMNRKLLTEHVDSVQARKRNTSLALSYTVVTHSQISHSSDYIDISHKPVLKMVDRDLTEDEVADLKEAFAMFDINGDGMSVWSFLRFLP